MAERFKTGPARIGDVQIDVVISEQHDAQNEISAYPVEKGADITDHVRRKPRTVSLECVISDTPILLEQVRRTREFQGVTFTSSAGTEATPNDALGYSNQAYAELLRMRDEAQVVEVVTSLETYEDMMISSLSTPVTAKTGDAIQFTCVLQHVEFVALQSTLVVTEVPRVRGKRGQAGSTARHMVTAPEPVDNRTRLKRARDGGGGILGVTKNLLGVD